MRTPASLALTGEVHITESGAGGTAYIQRG